MKKRSKIDQNIWGIRTCQIQMKKDLNKAIRMLNWQIWTVSDKSRKKDLKEILHSLYLGKGHDINNHRKTNYQFSPNYLVISEIVEKRKLHNLLDIMYKFEEYFYPNKKNFFGIIPISDVDNCISSINSWLGYTKSMTSLRPMIFNEKVEYFSGLTICFHDLIPSMVSVDFILNLRDDAIDKLKKDLDNENVPRNIFPQFFEVDGRKAVGTTTFANYIVRQKMFIEDIVSMKWSFLEFLNKKIGLETYLYKLGIPAVSILYSELNPDYFNDTIDPLAILCGPQIKILKTKKESRVILVEEDVNQLLMNKNYNCLDLIWSNKFENKDLVIEIMEKWYVLGQIYTIYSVILNKKSIQESYLNDVLSTKSKVINYKSFIKKNYGYSEEMLEHDELLKAVEIDPFEQDFVNLANTKFGKEKLQNVLNNVTTLLQKVNNREKFINDLVTEKNNILTSKYETLVNRKHSIYSSFSLIIAIIALITSLMTQWKDIYPMLEEIINYFKHI